CRHQGRGRAPQADRAHGGVRNGRCGLHPDRSDLQWFGDFADLRPVDLDADDRAAGAAALLRVHRRARGRRLDPGRATPITSTVGPGRVKPQNRQKARIVTESSCLEGRPEQDIQSGFLRTLPCLPWLQDLDCRGSNYSALRRSSLTEVRERVLSSTCLTMMAAYRLWLPSFAGR